MVVHLYSMFVSEENKTKCISKHFCSKCNGCYYFIRARVTNCVPLFSNVFKLLESVLCLIDIRVTAYVCQYL